MGSNIIQVISNLEDMRFIKAASADEIKKAESILGVEFARDYREYVSTYGVISARGVELTGITHHERLSVVCVTERERILNSNIPSDMYVIENIGIDGIVALQDKKGIIYTITPKGKPQKMCDSLVEYIERSKF